MSKQTKNIKLNQNYQPNIESLEKEQKVTNEIINNIYSRFISEDNANNREYALNALNDYRYIRNDYIIPCGRFVRYIDTKDHNNMKLKLGGFVTSDNGYSFVYKSCAGDQRIVKVNKKHCIIFISITYDEQLRCAIKTM